MAPRPLTTPGVEHHNALVYARRHLKTHIAWRDFLRAGGELPDPKIGDLAHQERAIHELETICKALRAGGACREKIDQWLEYRHAHGPEDEARL